ncbi:MAG TPA: hypothetical protein VE309_00685 [Caulobacteraceae bacterium]|jgi:hypothetical protein|nr:hypothetical protein [Caulobacteraceae bacterium]
MTKDSEADGHDQRRELLFVGTCAAVFLVLAACAVYAVVTFVI